MKMQIAKPLSELDNDSSSSSACTESDTILIVKMTKLIHYCNNIVQIKLSYLQYNALHINYIMH